MIKEDIFLSMNDVILTALKKLENTTCKICLVIHENQIVGTITDGDIRRALLKDHDLNGQVSHIMNDNPVLMHKDDNPRDFIQAMKKDHFKYLPVIDSSRKVVDLLKLEDLQQVSGNFRTAVIMAGGLGMRLRPLTEHIPKPMLKVGGVPILHQLIARLRKHNIQNIYISVNYKKEIIQDYFKDGSKFGVEIKYLTETQPLGTAGSLGLIEPLPPNPCLILNADLITKVDLDSLFEFHNVNLQDATICVRQYQLPVPYGVVKLLENGNLVEIVEKPSNPYLINAGIYVVNPKLFSLIPKDQYLDMTKFLHKVIQHGYTVKSFLCYEEWIDVGSKEDMAKAQELII